MEETWEVFRWKSDVYSKWDDWASLWRSDYSRALAFDAMYSVAN